MRPIHATQLYLLDVLYLHVYITDMPPLMPSIVFGYFHFVFIYFCCSIYIFTRPMQHNCIWICSICMFTSQTCPPPTIPTYHLSYLDVCIFLWLYLYLHMANATQLYLDMLNLHVYIPDTLPLFPILAYFFLIFLIFYGWCFFLHVLNCSSQPSMIHIG